MTSEPSLSPDLVATEAAKDLLRRPVFAAIGTRPRPLGGHVAVNGYDLARVESEAYERGITAAKAGETPPEIEAQRALDAKWAKR